MIKNRDCDHDWYVWDNELLKCNHCKIELNIKLAENGQRMQWVSVEDRLPNFNGKVIACINGKEVMGCSFNNDAKQFFHIQNLKNVTHWIPIPPQP